MGWLPIESAPKDGSKFIAAWRCGMSGKGFVSTDAYWWERGGKWISEGDGLIEPECWQPIPEPPATFIVPPGIEEEEGV